MRGRGIAEAEEEKRCVVGDSNDFDEGLSRARKQASSRPGLVETHQVNPGLSTPKHQPPDHK